jgi:glucosamine--fructose-6-phosphate aminotransferase (isomerizing)
MSFMRDEITAQPGLLRGLAPAWAAQAEACREALRGRPQLALVGRGSSGNACTFATYLWSLQTGRHPIEVRPWITTQAGPLASWEDTAVLALSVSGQSTDVAHTAAWLRARGAVIVGVTNADGEDSNLARVSDALFHLRVGEERAVPATKTFTAQLFAAAALCGLEIERPALQVARGLEQALADRVPEQLADALQGGRSVQVVARGPALAAALDGALKLQEAANMLAGAYSSAEILHGPVGALTPEDRVVVLEEESGGGESRQAVLTRLVGRGVPHVTLCGHPTGPTQHVGLELQLPEVRWARTPLMAAVLQATALVLAERRGLDPDQPPGLQKVTLT